MTYVWDERKRSANLEKHGLDFVDANLVHEAPVKVTFDLTRESRSERRFMDLAAVEGTVVALVYTLRSGSVRCISMRRAKRKERRVYHAATEARSSHE